jgi:hypothetical protein
VADEVVGRAIIDVDVDGASAAAVFAKLRADAERAMADIDRMEGNAKIDADKRPLDKKIAEARRQVLDLEKAKAEVAVDADTSALDRKLAKARLKVKELNQEKVEIKVDSDQIRDANKQLDLTAKRERAAEDAASKRAKADSTFARQRAKAADSEQRSLQRRGQLQSRALAEDARMAEQRARSQQRSLAAGRKEIDNTIRGRAELAKLRQEYGKTLGAVQQIQKTTGRPGGIFRTGTETRDLEAASAKLHSLEHDIRRLGGAVDDIDPSLERHQGVLSRWASSLASTTVRVGPFTASLKQLATAAVVLGPVLTGLGGGLTSLIGVVGTGLAGGLAVGSAALSGFVLTAAGIGLVLQPAIHEFGEAHKATEAYAKAVLKYGKTSDQAKTAQEQMNHVLAGISPNAQKAAKGWSAMKAKWSELTASTKGDVLSGINQGIKTATALLPSFAKETTASTKVASQAWTGWMKSLRSSEAKKLLGQVMSGFRESIPGIASGLGSIGAAFGRVAASASKLLPGLTSGFADWANGLEKSIGGGAGLDAGLDRIVGHMKDLGHLAQSSGSLLTNLFNTSANSGDDLVQSLTHVTDKWNAWVKSTHGQESLKDFFGEAGDETEKLFGVLGHLTNLLFQIGRATAPLSNGFLDFATAMGDVVSAITQVAPLRGMLTGLGVVLGGLWAVGKVKAFAGAIKDAAVALKGLATMQGISDLLGGAGVAGGTKTARRAEEAIVDTGAAARVTAGEVGIMGTAFGPVGIAVAAFVGGLLLLDATAEHVPDSFQKANRAFRKTGDELAKSTKSISTSSDEYSEALHHQKGSTDDVTEARRRLIHLQNQNAPMAKQTAAAYKLAAAERNQTQAIESSGRAASKNVHTARETLKAAEAHVKSLKEEAAATQKADHRLTGGKFGARGGGADDEANSAKNIAKAERDLANARKEVALASHTAALATIPYQRQLKGLDPLTQAATQSLRKLSTTIGTAAARKIGNFVDPKQVQQIANLGNRLTKLGQGSTVKKVAVQSQGADQTINKLQAVQRQSTKISGQTAKLNVKTDDRGAQQKLTKLGQLSQKVTGGRNTIRILANSSSAEQAIQRLTAHLRSVAQAKYQARVDAIDRTGGPLSAAQRKLLAIAQRHYQARLDAIDNTSAPTGKAKGNADKFSRGRYQAKLMADPSQALGAISSVSSQLAALDGKVANTKIINTTENVTVTKHRGGASGGPASGLRTTAYAAGGEPKPSSMVQQRAGERAIEEPAGRSRRVQTPRYLVGEESGHPEYVIATNPQYRDSNERYLNSAANDLGYEVVPAYAKGKGKSKPKKTASADPGPAPYKKQSKRHWTVHKHRFAPDSVTELNTSENVLQNLEGQFNAELTREEQEIAHKKRTAWDFGTLKGFLSKEEKIEQKIIGNLIPNIAAASNKAYTRADKELKGPLSAQKVHAAGKVAAALSKEYSNMKSPTKQKGESDADYKKRKKGYEHQKAVKKADAKEAAAYAKRLEKERSDAQKMKEDARQELTEVRQEVRTEHETSLKELQTESENIADVEANPELAPYYEAPGTSGSETPTLGEQTSSYNEARSDLYRSFAGNLSNGAAGVPSMSGGGAGTAGGGSPGSFNYGPGATTGLGSGPFEGAGNAATGTTPGPNTIINNFAYPPPDPHTWAAQQAFEIGSMA